ncbi:hypothetical protein ACFVEN_44195 [Streptomyces sp. NPDC057681]|uniref:hypothetical protein n=1 Tax=Streptomyces sp. NPDC057681 TaxID=3346209 RepID=UPI00369DF682
MANTTPSLDETLSAAQALMNERLDAVKAHKANVDAEDEARAALVERERESARTWAALLAAGWTVDELKRLDFKQPAVKAPGRPRGRARTKPEAPVTSTTLPGQASGDASSNAGASL